MDKICKKGYDFFFWKYQEHTKIKHFVLNKYLDSWIKILGKYSKLNFLDCHAGCGAYIENEKIYYGSSILAATTKIENETKLNRKVNLIVIEENKEHIENLIKVFKHHNISDDQYIIINDDFDNTINQILDGKGQLLPSFFFIDPFGFKIKYKTIKRIMEITKSEIFLNFMFNSINRFLSSSNLEKTLTELFGCKNWEHITSLPSNEREKEIIELYRTQLKCFSRYVFPYRMSFPDKRRTYYYLFHLTNHQLGCSIMKSSFAQFNYGRVEYRGPVKNALTFTDLEDFRISELKQFLIQNYLRKKISYDKIIDNLIDEVPSLEKEIKKALKELEVEQKISVNRITSKTSRGLRGEDICCFI